LIELQVLGTPENETFLFWSGGGDVFCMFVCAHHHLEGWILIIFDTLEFICHRSTTLNMNIGNKKFILQIAPPPKKKQKGDLLDKLSKYFEEYQCSVFIPFFKIYRPLSEQTEEK
jgi:hypothetical protein